MQDQDLVYVGMGGGGGGYTGFIQHFIEIFVSYCKQHKVFWLDWLHHHGTQDSKQNRTDCRKHVKVSIHIFCGCGKFEKVTFWKKTC